jgi:hypothetical protein
MQPLPYFMSGLIMCAPDYHSRDCGHQVMAVSPLYVVSGKDMPLQKIRLNVRIHFVF